MGKKIWLPIRLRNFGSQVTVRPPARPTDRPTDRPSASQAYQCKITRPTYRYCKVLYLEVILAGNSPSHSHLVKQRQLLRANKAEVIFRVV